MDLATLTYKETHRLAQRGVGLNGKNNRRVFLQSKYT